MKNALASLFLLCLLSTTAVAQSNTIRPKAIGVSFILNDFTTPQRIRSSSLQQVTTNNKWAKIQEMSPGLAVTYFKGLRPHLDFAGTLAGSFANYSFPSKQPFPADRLLLEADASINLKMFDESYWVTPYLSVGAGGSKYGNYYGAFIPLGLGMKLNLFDEASVFLGTQYRVPVTFETTNYHFMYSLGVSGIIGKNK
jgi:OOP family OmpA-OmpF porin